MLCCFPFLPITHHVRLQEWLKEVQSELDFLLEARNMGAVRSNLAATDIPVTVPRVIDGLVGSGVLVMRYIEGVKVRASPSCVLLSMSTLKVAIRCAFSHVRSPSYAMVLQRRAKSCFSTQSHQHAAMQHDDAGERSVGAGQAGRVARPARLPHLPRLRAHHLPQRHLQQRPAPRQLLRGAPLVPAIG